MDLRLIFSGPDGLQALAERHRTELQALAAQASAEAAEILRELVDAGRRFLAAYATAQPRPSRSIRNRPNHPGHRADDLGRARVPGDSPLDAVAIELGERPFVGARNAPAGQTWLDPVKTLGLLFDALHRRDCLLAAAAVDPRAGGEGVYRRVTDGQVEVLDGILALSRGDKRAEALGQDGYSVYPFEARAHGKRSAKPESQSGRAEGLGRRPAQPQPDRWPPDHHVPQHPVIDDLGPGDLIVVPLGDDDSSAEAGADQALEHVTSDPEQEALAAGQLRSLGFDGWVNQAGRDVVPR